MAHRIILLAAATVGMLAAQNGTKTKSSAQDYPAHSQLPLLSIGAEFTVHSFSRGDQVFVAKNYLVVEVALFPAAGQTVLVNDGNFTLRVNGHKQAIEHIAPEIVANTLKYRAENPQGVHPAAQVGPWVIGQPRPVERFPGDPNARNPAPPAGSPDDSAPGVEQAPPAEADEVVVEAALQEGVHKFPSSGFLYFPYHGSIAHIHSLELIFTSESGHATIALFTSDAKSSDWIGSPLRFAMPTVADGRVYVGTRGAVYAFGLRTAAMKARRP